MTQAPIRASAASRLFPKATGVYFLKPQAFLYSSHGGQCRLWLTKLTAAYQALGIQGESVGESLLDFRTETLNRPFLI